MTLQVYGFDLLSWPHLKEPSHYPDANELFDPRQGLQVYREHLDQMQLYEDCGFDGICLNEHHAKPYGLMPSPNLLAAALTQRTKRIKIGIFGNLAPLHGHPVRLAEELAMLDHLSDGRLIAGFVRGVPQEYLAMSVPLAESRGRHEEAIDLVLKAWTSREPFAWDGKYYHYDRVSIWPRPLGQPHPPIVLPAESADGIEHAARLRASTGVAYRSVTKAKEILTRYRQAAAEHGWTPGPLDQHLMRFIYVADTDARAREEAEPHLSYFWQKLLSYQRGSFAIMGIPPSAQAAVGEGRAFWDYDFEFTQKLGLTIVGSVETVTETILAQVRELGVGVLLGLFSFGDLPNALARKNIELFAERVLPAVRPAAVDEAAYVRTDR